MSKNKRFSESVYEKWCSMYVRGETTKSIAKLYEVSAQTVVYHLDKRGITRRSNSESHLFDASKVSLELSYEAKQVIIGSAIGDGNIKKQSTAAILQLAHAENQREWLSYKAEMLNSILAPSGITTRENGGGRQRIFEARTLPNNYIESVYDKSYLPNGERSISQLIPLIDIRALSVLWGDDGCFGKSGNSVYGILSSCRYSFEENQMLVDHLKDKFDIDSTLLQKKVRGKVYPQIRIKQNGVLTLREIICEYLPESMQYKIGA